MFDVLSCHTSFAIEEGEEGDSRIDAVAAEGAGAGLKIVMTPLSVAAFNPAIVEAKGISF